MKLIKFLFNIFYTIIGLFFGVISGVQSVRWHANPWAIVMRVRGLWWMFGYMRGGRAFALGNVVVLGPNIKSGDLEHELIHVRQYERYPLIFPFLYYTELFRKGYRKNRFEEEAYTDSNSVYVHHMHLNKIPFELIRQGKQQIETRLCDEKRQLIEVGDEIEFVSREHPDEKIRVKVVELIRKPTFSELYDAVSFVDVGNRTKEKYLADQGEYYSPEEEKKWGVLGIRVVLL
jgi:ASC-1-like (ASCH) protein